MKYLKIQSIANPANEQIVSEQDWQKMKNRGNDRKFRILNADVSPEGEANARQTTVAKDLQEVGYQSLLAEATEAFKEKNWPLALEKHEAVAAIKKTPLVTDKIKTLKKKLNK